VKRERLQNAAHFKFGSPAMRIAKHMRLAVFAMCSLSLLRAVNLTLEPTFSRNGFDVHAILGITVTYWHNARKIIFSDFNQ
jgi:hypothetical protein